MTPRTGTAKSLCEQANQYIIDFMKSVFTAANNNQTDFIEDLRHERIGVPSYAEIPVTGYSIERVEELTNFIDQFLALRPESMTALQARFEADRIRETLRSATRLSAPRPR